MNDQVNIPNDPSEKASIGFGIWIVLGLIIIVWGAYWALVAPTVTGNQFDPLNTLFSGLAFWGVIYAILLQKSELELQREELKRTRAQIQGQKEQLEVQNVTLKQQRFENTFFSLLDFCGSMTNSMELTINTYATPLTRKGRDCFFEYYKEFQQEYRMVQARQKDLSLSELCDAAYSAFLRNRMLDVDAYFGTLYNIVKFVAESDIEPKHLYINIIRAQLSAPQLALLFYSCLSTSGNHEFKPLIEHSCLFRNFPHGLLLDQTPIRLYEESAFTDQS